jgi:hypothetical protein
MARLLTLWAVLALSLAVSTIATSVIVFRDLDLTQTMFFSLLMIPTVEATVVAAFMRPQAGTILSGATMRRAVAHPLAGPVLWIDAVVVPAGWLFLHHPLVGMAAAGILQRRWMGTKLIAAAISLGFAALQRDARMSAVGRGTLVTMAVVLAAIGVNGFQPLLQTTARHLPAPLLRQPWPFVIFELYAVVTVALIRLVLRSGRLLATMSSAAAELYDAAAGALFVTALFVTMNGFLSLQPVEPWAGLAMTSGSIAGTILAIAGILLAARNGAS